MEGRRPGALTALAIISIVLGALITLNGFWQVATLAFQEPLQNMNLMFMEQPGVPEETIERQREMMEASFAVQREWRPFNWAMSPVSFLFGIVLIIGGSLCVRVNPAGRKLLAAACGFGIIFGIVREVGAVMMQLQISQVVQDHMTAMVDQSGDEQAEAIMSGMMGATMAITVAFGGGWLLVKLGIYIWGLVYLSLRGTRAVFEGPPVEELFKPEA